MLITMKMSSLCYVCVLASWTVIIVGYCYAKFIHVRVEKNWDGLLFTQQWPITACIDHIEKHPNALCNLYPNMTSWTVHGLWPTKIGTRGPNFCNETWEFDESQIKSIEPGMLKNWPNIFAEDTRTSLWEHEWDKHGTCAAELTSLNSEFNYFNRGLELNKKHDFVSYLAYSEIFPSDDQPYKLKDINAAIKHFVRKDPIIDCIYNKDRKAHELSQIKICLDRSLSLMSCDRLLSLEKSKTEIIHGNCPSEGIIYPSSVITNELKYSFTKELAEKHLYSYAQDYYHCQTWICSALRAVKYWSLLLP